MTNRAPIFLAIDTSDLKTAQKLAADVSPYFKGIKLGLEFFMRFGSDGVRSVLKAADHDTKFFLDLKFHDIPNTVFKSVQNTLDLKPDFVTVHAAGGTEMLKAAVKAVENTKTKILAVTVLTSLDDADIKTISGKTVQQTVLDYAAIAEKAGVHGLVCSPHELKVLNQKLDSHLDLIVPGIRLHADNTDDQKRIMTPIKALENGASYLVIGRAVTQSDQPALVAKKIAHDILEKETKVA